MAQHFQHSLRHDLLEAIVGGAGALTGFMVIITTFLLKVLVAYVADVGWGHSLTERVRFLFGVSRIR